MDNKSKVLAAIDIVELIGQSVKLKRNGRRFTGLCPFHNEKTPSFSVNAEDRFFYCFGCKAHGNAIDFVMKRDRVEFVDALKMLADQAGIELEKFGKGNGESASERQQLLEAQSAAAAFFQANLASPEGAPAREYLEKRGFDAGSIRSFQIGYAPPGWDNLLRSEVGRKFSQETLLKAGLLKHNEERGSFYDVFRNRLMFSIRDDQGRIIAFGGRVMPGSDDKAKYLNSPETMIFSKSRCAFGMDLAKKRIVETRTAVVVEGYTDVIMCHQFGVSNVVSVLGTALTSEHVKLIKRFADRLVLLFDPDLAGDMAVNRSVELFLTQPIEVLVATLPEQMDPDEYLLEYGAEGFNKVIADAQDALNYKWKLLDKQYRSSEGDMTGQQKAVEEYLQTLADARGSGPVDALRWGAALARVSRLTGIETEELNRRFRIRAARPRVQPAPRPEQTGEPVSAGSGLSGGADVVDESARAAAPRSRGPMSAQLRAERQVLGALLASPQWWQEVQQHVTLNDFLEEPNRKLAEVFWDFQRNEGEPVFAEFLEPLKPLGLDGLAMELWHEVEAFDDLEKLLQPAVAYLGEARAKRESARLSMQIRRSTEAGENDDAVDLLKKLTEAAKRPNLRKGF